MSKWDAIVLIVFMFTMMAIGLISVVEKFIEQVICNL